MKRWLLLLMGYTSFAFADIASDMDDFFNRTGFASNTTNFKAVESQASGYFGGGSLYARSAVRNYELVTLDLPDYRAGCAGIDLFTGSISYLSGDKLVNLGKQIMSNSGAYAVDVMLATTVPELKQVRDFLQSTVQKINQSSINSCEMAQNLVGGVWPKTVASQQKICNDQLRMGQSGGAHDYVSARMHCAGDGFNDTIENSSKNKATQQQVVMNKNLVWSLLQSKSFLRENIELSELVMSLTGTIIIDKAGHITEVPAMADNTKLIQTLLGDNSKDTFIWGCDETTQCLHVHQKQVLIPAHKALQGRIHQLISDIDEKLKSDVELNAEEKGFLEMTSLPVLKFFLVLNSTQAGNAATDIDAYSALIAQDLLSHYLKDLLLEATRLTETSQLPESLTKKLTHRIQYAHQTIAAIEPKVSNKLMQKLTLIQQVSGVEKQVAATFGEGLR